MTSCIGTAWLLAVTVGLCMAFAPLPAHAQNTPATTEQSPEQTPEQKQACQRTTLQEAVRIARDAIAAQKTATKDQEAENTDALSVELAINAVPRYYDIILFDKDRNYLARVDEASAHLLNLTQPAEARDKDITRKTRQLGDTMHVSLERVIQGAVEARPRGIPTAARLDYIFGNQPIYEVIMRMPPGNDEVLIVDGLSGDVIELENFE